MAGDWLVGGGEMGKLIRSMDWSNTPLGPMESWPPSLRTTVGLVLNSNFPISLAWGPRHTQIYNDGYWPICGPKHPRSMGQDFSECWATAWPAIGGAFHSALAGSTAFLEDQRMFLDRLGYLEETFFTFSFSPIRDETGKVAGLFHPVTETTSKMVGQRRTRVLREVGQRAAEATSMEEGLKLAAGSLAESGLDLPFALFYRVDASRPTAELVAQTGLAAGGPASPLFVDLTRDTEGWPLAALAAEGKPVELQDVRDRFPGLVCGLYPEPIRAAFLLPVTPPGQARPICLVVAGASTRLPLNEGYRAFYELLAATVATVVANATAREAERKRAEALAEIDRAKTAFFSNVSHEFRTPLTLILGPLTDELAEPDAVLPPARRERIEAARRNSLRLLKLVNTLLDFSRIEAGRVQAVYEPTDLAGLTADLAGNFHSACQRAGLGLKVDCPPLPEAVYVDREMWEKIVLNLLSNAFKFTLAGEIEVKLRPGSSALGVQPSTAVLTVRDSGVGIPAEELARVFERFYRVKNTEARTHEGTGIGLALVQELVALHGGAIRTVSAPGQGSVFTVTLPLGTAHLPAERLGAARLQASTALGAAPYLEEALRWLPSGSTETRSEAPGPAESLAAADEPLRPERAPAAMAEASPSASGASPRPRIIWADDNADMRDYVRRLLADHYEVEAVADGREALAAVRRRAPDLVLADVMMPRLDGFGLLRELQADQRARAFPIVLLSARAGEEARIEGLKAGADSYLVKPFSARELLAVIGAQIDIARARREAEELRRNSEKALALEAANAVLRESQAAAIKLMEDAEVARRQAEQAATALREERDWLAALLDSISDEIWFADEQGKFTLVNAAAVEAFGLKLGIGKKVEEVARGLEVFRSDGSLRPLAETPPLRALKGELVRDQGEIVRLPPTGELRYRQVSASPVKNHEGRIIGSVSVVRDVTERRQAEEAAQEAEERLHFALESCQIGAWDIDLEEHVAFRSLQHDRIFGYQELLPRWTLDDFLGHALPEYRDEVKAMVRDATAAKTGWTYECRIRRADGELRWIWFSGRYRTTLSGRSRVVGIVQDITERKRSEEAIRASLREKEVMLKEIHHRVKNNLQVIASLVDLQAGGLQDPGLLEMFADIRDRVRSMVLVHEKLYQSESLARVDFADYMSSLLGYLARSHSKLGSQVELKRDLQPVSLSVEKAMPCGLIVNELVSNAYKHAFRGRAAGVVTVALGTVADGRVFLRVGDNGVGLPQGTDWRQSRSLGLRLIQLLSGQLRATVEVRTEGGTAFEIAFEPEKSEDSA